MPPKTPKGKAAATPKRGRGKGRTAPLKRKATDSDAEEESQVQVGKYFLKFLAKKKCTLFFSSRPSCLQSTSLG